MPAEAKSALKKGVSLIPSSAQAYIDAGDGASSGDEEETIDVLSQPRESAITLRRGTIMRQIYEKRTVMVCVRIRPFNTREKDRNAVNCIEVNSPESLTITENKKKKGFTFDAVFPIGSTQTQCYELSVQPILHKAIQGFNGCVFAYGQTGAGKTFTMMGYGKGEDAGVIPQLCNELFEQIEMNEDQSYGIQISYLEIYQEQLRDLLAGKPKKGKKAKKKLKISVDAKGARGVFVSGIEMRDVTNYDQVETFIDKGNAIRQTGATAMNATSSRSHAVLTIYIHAQDKNDMEGWSKKICKLHMIDLAGSERAASTGATGAALKEGAAINASLSALGNVVNALTSKSKHIPYRDSKLTRLLQDSLGGNAYTLMISNLSPADINDAETLGTLRFAERAKKIKNKAVVNQDPTLAKIGKLMAEIKELKAKLKRGGGAGSGQLLDEMKKLEEDNKDLASKNVELLAECQNLASIINKKGTTGAAGNKVKKRMSLFQGGKVINVTKIVHVPKYVEKDGEVIMVGLELEDEDEDHTEDGEPCCIAKCGPIDRKSVV